MGDKVCDILSVVLTSFIKSSDPAKRSEFFEHVVRGLDIVHIDDLRVRSVMCGLSDVTRACINEIVARSKYHFDKMTIFILFFL